MWQIDNATPFAASGHWVRDRNGAEIWLVAVRCTFQIQPDGSPTVAEVQEPPVLAPIYSGEPGKSSLLYDSDFYLTKPTTDVVLHGCAYAPGGKPAKDVEVTMRVGAIKKTLRAIGDRPQQSFASGSPTPFTKMPLTYERTYGGSEPDPPRDPNRPRFEPRNPVGTGFSADSQRPGPNIVSPGVNLTSTPVGFGPIPTHWVPRVRHAGTYDDAWQRTRYPLYPTDLDDRFFLCSPEDQRPPEHLRGGEPVELLNLTPSGRLAFQLPRLAFRWESHFRNRPSRVHRGKLHTVILEPEVPRVILVWQSALPAHADVLRLTETRVSQLRVLNERPSGPGDFDLATAEDAPS
jgi:hypothetical protein